MNTIYPNLTYKHPDGQVTTYDIQEVQHGDGPQSYVVSEAASNQGPGFESQPTRDLVAHDASARIQSKEDLQPYQVKLYQQKPDGDFEKVDFSFTGHVANRDAQGQDWSESHRETYSRAQVQQELRKDLHAPAETPQQLQQRQNQEYKDMEGPQGFNRAEVSAEERSQLQAQVDRQTNQTAQNQQSTEQHKQAHAPQY